MTILLLLNFYRFSLLFFSVVVDFAKLDDIVDGVDDSVACEDVVVG